MRPVDKGSHPEENGKRVEFRSYQDAAPYLKERLGHFCSYCERKIPTNLAVEHVMPKSRRPDLEKEWDNFLLACTNCNSKKGNKPIERDDYLWPDRDDTFSAFRYQRSGAIHPSPDLDVGQQTKATALLTLVGLNNGDIDKRHTDRREQWDKAERTLTQLQNMPIDQKKKFLDLIVTESYSIWATVFRTDPVMLATLATLTEKEKEKFPNTKRY